MARQAEQAPDKDVSRAGAASRQAMRGRTGDVGTAPNQKQSRLASKTDNSAPTGQQANHTIRDPLLIIESLPTFWH